MISKSRLLFYSLFCPNKHIPRVAIEPLWYHKCLLVVARRYKSFDDIPHKISYYDWMVAKKMASKMRSFVIWSIIYFSIGYTAYLWRQSDVKRVNQKLEEMKRDGKPFVPKFNPMGENPIYRYGPEQFLLPPKDYWRKD